MSDGARPRVLVVDDDEVIRRLIVMNLQLDDFETATAVDGKDCLKQVRVFSPSVVLLDIVMPRLDGLSVLARLRADDSTSGIGVCLVSALAQEADVRRGLDAGADAYVTKPFDPADLMRVVSRLARVSSGRSRGPDGGGLR